MKAEVNPYESSFQQALDEASPSLLKLTLGFVALTGFLGALVGAGLGVLIALTASDYYSAMFSRSGGANLNPVAIGFGMGVTQGLGGGAGVGIALTALFYWYRSRTNPSDRQDAS